MVSNKIASREDLQRFVQSLSSEITVPREEIFDGRNRSMTKAFCFMLLDIPVFVKPKKANAFFRAAFDFDGLVGMYIEDLCTAREDVTDKDHKEKVDYKKNIVWRPVVRYNKEEHIPLSEYVMRKALNG